jgi:hypothetical protein
VSWVLPRNHGPADHAITFEIVVAGVGSRKQPTEFGDGGGERNGLDAGDESVVDGGGCGAARSSSGHGLEKIETRVRPHPRAPASEPKVSPSSTERDYGATEPASANAAATPSRLCSTAWRPTAEAGRAEQTEAVTAVTAVVCLLFVC